jgi:transmembrane sensor
VPFIVSTGATISADAQADIPTSIVDEAIAWCVKLEFGEPAPDTRAAFADWLRKDPRHAVAWQRLQTLGGEFARVPPALALNTLDAAAALRRQARGTHARRRTALKVLGSAGLAFCAGWVARDAAPWQRWLADAATATGEQRTLRLDDGSQLTLGTDTGIRIAFAGTRRTIELRRGEILVTTGHDGDVAARTGNPRPFRVRTPYGDVRALGTRFVVRLDEGQARVSVQEGAVALHPSDGQPPDESTPIARPGQTWLLRADAAEPAPAPTFRPDGWAEGVIEGRNMRLADLLAELSRYRVGHIACDPGVANLPVTGTFHLADTDNTLRFLAQTLPVRLVYRTRFWVGVVPAHAG